MTQQALLHNHYITHLRCLGGGKGPMILFDQFDLSTLTIHEKKNETKHSLGVVVHELFQCVGREVFLILR